jgi:Flp pilus assembly protein TadG
MLKPSLRRRGQKRTRGQSLVEFALLVPVLLLILLLSIDFGRAFYSWVILQNAARIGANYAGLNAQGWEPTPDDPAIVAEYQALVNDDVDEALCTSPVVPDPVFTDGTDTSGLGQTPDTAYNVGDTTKVELTCVFHPLTPVVSAIVSTNVTLGASSEFRIRAGQIAGLNNASAIPMPSVATPTPTATPTATPTGATCGLPTANFNPPSSQIGNSPLVVIFNDTSTTPAGCPITTWSWIFEGGSPPTAIGQGPHTVTFTKPPTQHDVTLTVTNAGGSDVEFRNNFVRTN